MDGWWGKRFVGRDERGEGRERNILLLRVLNYKDFYGANSMQILPQSILDCVFPLQFDILAYFWYFSHHD